MDENKVKALHKLKDSLLSVNGSLLKVSGKNYHLIK